MVAVLDQMDQEIEHLGLDRNRPQAVAQLPPVGVKPMIGKQKFHDIALDPTRRAGLKP